MDEGYHIAWTQERGGRSLPPGFLLAAIALAIGTMLCAVLAGLMLYKGAEFSSVWSTIGLAILQGIILLRLLEQSPHAAPSSEELALTERSHRLATMSHELRTPLNGIIGMLSLLSETSLSPHQKNFAETAQSSSRTLLSIIDEILGTAKAETLGKPNAPFDPVALVESVTELLAPRAHAKGIEISARVAGAVPGEIVTDELRLRQLLFNLAGNAIKFTEKGGVAIALSMNGLDTLVLEVKDTGIGMTADEQARIFEAFVQANDQTQRKFGGTGLGLAISRSLVEEAGGTISVASKPGHGTTFTVSLPIKAVTAAESGKRSLEGRHYLLALPQGFARTHLAEILNELGAEVSLIETPSALAGALKTASPLQHFICASPYFPLLRKWAKSGNRNAHVWVMLKAEERQSHLDLLRAPFAGYLLNPLRRSTLLARLASHDGKALKQAGQKLRKAKALPKAPVSDRLFVLLAEDNAVNALLSRIHLERLGHKVKLVVDGAAALAALKSDEHFDLALLDVEMPRMTGFEVATAVRKAPELAHRRDIPILALTANARPEDLRACLASGMGDHLAKPFDRLDLEDKIASLMKMAAFRAA